MAFSEIRPGWRWIIFAGIIFVSAALIASAGRHEIAAHWSGSSNPEMWLRAAQTEPSNAALWYRLGRYRQLNFQNADLPLAISYYERATSINPVSASYWMDLGSAYETAGKVAEAEQAFLKARQLYPISAEAAWRFGNFLLRQQRVPEAFAQIHEAVVSDPKLTNLAVSLCWRSTHDIDQILQTVPDEHEENWGAMQFFVQAREPVAAMTVWKRIASHREHLAASGAFPLFDLLIDKGRADDAQTVWSQALAANGIAMTEVSAGGSLVWNGGFEQEPLNGGFDWRITPSAGAELKLDEQSFRSGLRSLRADFDGTENIDFQNVWQYVLVRPKTRYRVSAFFRTRDLTTESGIGIEVRDISNPGSPAHLTPNLVGTQPWTEEDAEFVTGADTKVVQIVLRRTRSAKLANKLRGTAWVDDVALVPLPASKERSP